MNYDFIESDELLLSIDELLMFIDATGQFIFHFFFVAQTADIATSAKAVGEKIIGG